jgi:hypothetical protein
MTTKITEKNISSLANAGVSWQSVVVADGSTGLTAVAGRGYFINTTSGTITVTFPASPTAGDTIVINDYATTFATNNVTINFNGNKLEANTDNAILSTNDQTHTFVFTDATQGWKIVNQDTGASLQPSFIAATGGTITTDGDFKVHSFTGDGCFVVSSLGNPLIPAAARNTVDYLVVAGGAGSGNYYGGGGGAGGFRESKDSTLSSPHTASPLAASTGITVTATTYPITVGAGGAGTPAPTDAPNVGGSGGNSVFSTITSAGGGGGSGGYPTAQNGASGGSGGGAGGYNPQSGGAGNTPPVSPSQGNPGGSNTSFSEQAGGGGATAAGGNTTPGPLVRGSAGGAGAGTAINPSPSYGTPGPSPTLRYFAGGGGGVNFGGGVGGGGNGSCNPVAPVGTAGTTNTGGGGGTESKNGGSGIVVIRYKFQ